MHFIVQSYSFIVLVANEFMAPPNQSIKNSSPLWTGTQVGLWNLSQSQALALEVVLTERRSKQLCFCVDKSILKCFSIVIPGTIINMWLELIQKYYFHRT